MKNKKFADLTELEKNILITERLFGLKVVIPKDYYANLKGKNADYWREQNPTPSETPVVVKGNRPLKTHQIESYPMPDFYEENAFNAINRARAAIFSKNFHLRFAQLLVESFDGPDFWDLIYWNLVNCSPAKQADAIVKIILENKI